MSPNQSSQPEVLGPLVKAPTDVTKRTFQPSQGSSHVSKLGNRWSVIGTEENITEKNNQEYFVICKVLVNLLIMQLSTLLEKSVFSFHYVTHSY